MAALQEAGRRKLQQVESDSAKEHASMQQALACLRGSCWDSLAVKAFSLVGMRAASCKARTWSSPSIGDEACWLAQALHRHASHVTIRKWLSNVACGTCSRHMVVPDHVLPHLAKCQGRAPRQ